MKDTRIEDAVRLCPALGTLGDSNIINLLEGILPALSDEECTVVAQTAAVTAGEVRKAFPHVSTVQLTTETALIRQMNSLIEQFEVRTGREVQDLGLDVFTGGHRGGPFRITKMAIYLKPED